MKNLGWAEFISSDKEWDSLVENFKSKNVYQTSFHKIHFELLGWIIRRFTYTNENGVVCLFQARVKVPLPGLFIFSVIGGPIGDQLKLLELKNLKASGIKYFHMRFFSMEIYDESIKEELIENKVKFFQTPGLSGLSAKLDLSKSLDDFNKGFNRRWKRAIKSAQKENLKIEIWNNINVTELIRIYRELESNKGLDITFSNNELLTLVDAYKENLVVLSCREMESNNLISVRGALVFKDYALDYLSATNNEGRDLKASFLLTYDYLIYLKSLGVRHFDFSGVNPEFGKGVYEFKMGAGAELIKYMGEFEISSSKGVSLIVGLMWNTKQKIQKLKSKLLDKR
jgi:hypothetical protein